MSSRARSGTPTGGIGGRRARSTRSARATTQRSTAASRSRGRDNDGGRFRVTDAPARKWTEVLRPPAPGVKFCIPTWVPVDSLTPEEREDYLISLEEEKRRKEEANKILEETTPSDQVEGSRTKDDHVATTALESTKTEGEEESSSNHTEEKKETTIKEDPAEENNGEPPLKRAKLDSDVPKASETVASSDPGPPAREKVVSDPANVIEEKEASPSPNDPQAREEGNNEETNKEETIAGAATNASENSVAEKANAEDDKQGQMEESTTI